MMAVNIINSMIDEIFETGRRGAEPLLGGGHSAPFDGEELGAFIRYAVLSEARARIEGIELDYTQVSHMFKQKWTANDT